MKNAVQDKEEDKGAEAGQAHDLCVFPPHLAAEANGSSAEGHALVGGVIGAVHEQLDPFATAEDLFDVVRHDILDACEFGLGLCDRIDRLRICVELTHERRQRGWRPLPLPLRLRWALQMTTKTGHHPKEKERKAG